MEFNDFQHNIGPFDKETIWFTKTMLVGNYHVLHEFYSLPYTGVLGFINCRVCSKLLVIFPYERSWVDLKNKKIGNRSHLGEELTKKRSVLYPTANIDDVRMNRNIIENIDAGCPNAMFGDDDIK